jgi:hypothetical protein
MRSCLPYRIRESRKGSQTGLSVTISARDPEILGSIPRAGGRCFRVGGEMFRASTSASVPRLEVKCCAGNHVHVSSTCSHSLVSANAAAKVSRSYGYLSSKVE